MLRGLGDDVHTARKKEERAELGQSRVHRQQHITLYARQSARASSFPNTISILFWFSGIGFIKRKDAQIMCIQNLKSIGNYLRNSLAF
jgi:hypothetical protein